MTAIESANWVIERISAFAAAIGDPFSEREKYMLRQSIDFFDDSMREEFIALNKKTVMKIRETIVDEKLDGSDCVEVRHNLFIPPLWKEHYLNVYESDLPWMISHCAQSALINEPTLGETEPWISPRVTSGFRESILKKAKKNNSVNSADEFSLITATVNLFLLTNDWIWRSEKFIHLVLAGENAEDEMSRVRSRVEVINIFNSIGDVDDDVTSAWSLFLLDEKIHDSGVDRRELLRSKTRFGVNSLLSKSNLVAKGLLKEDFLESPSELLLLIAMFDYQCMQIGVRPVAVKHYAVLACRLAAIAANSTLFTDQTEVAIRRVQRFAQTLDGAVRMLERCLDQNWTLEQFIDQMRHCEPLVDGPVAYMNLVELGKKIDSESLAEWRDEFHEALDLLRDQVESEQIDGDQFESFREDADETHDRHRSPSHRLRQIDELLDSGLITLEEYEVKRREILNDI